MQHKPDLLVERIADELADLDDEGMTRAEVIALFIRDAFDCATDDQFRVMVGREAERLWNAAYEEGDQDGYERGGREWEDHAVAEERERLLANELDYDPRPYGPDVDRLERDGYDVLARFDGVLPGSAEWWAAEDGGPGSANCARITSPTARWYQLDRMR